jgi:cytochrome c-type biogenesis protein CcmH
MKSKIIFFILAFFIFSSIHANENIKVNDIFKNLRCLVCQGQSIADSNSDFASTVKLVVEEWILYKPSFDTKNFFLWILPYLVLVSGGIILYVLLRKKPKL